MDNLDGSSSSEKTSSSSDSENENPVHGESKVEETKQKSRQLQYYHRKTGGKMKRKYTLFRDQENPSRQLKRYHGVVREACSTLPASMNTAGSAERISETNMGLPNVRASESHCEPCESCEPGCEPFESPF